MSSAGRGALLRLVGLPLLVVVALGGIALASRGEPAAPLAKAGSLTSTHEGKPLLKVRGMVPGQSVARTVSLRYSGRGRNSLFLKTKRLVDRPGPGGGVLSSVLRVKVQRLGQKRAHGPKVARRTVYRGRLAALPGGRVASIRGGRKRRIRIIVSFPDSGLPSSNVAGDNRFQGSRSSFDLSWRVARSR